jgi:hypothetical protein
LQDRNNNEDQALLHSRENNITTFRNWLSPGDIVIVDRGYRDSLTLLDEIGVKHWMPPLLNKKVKQFTADEANKSRLITKTRWIVEARNGHIKSKYKFFRSTVPMAHLTTIGDFFRICCALLNAFSPPMENG